MPRTSVLTLAIVTAVTWAAIVGTAAVGSTSSNGTSCTCSTVDLESGSVTLVVLADGSGGASTSVSQQVSQTNGDARVRIDVSHGEADVRIAGETVANGSLVLNVTRNGEVVNESVVADGDEVGTVTFHLESDGVRISTGEDTSPECPCEDTNVNAGDGDVADVDSDEACTGNANTGTNADGGVNVGHVVEDTNVRAGNVEVNVPVLSPGSDSNADAEQLIEDGDDDFRSQSNTAGDGANATNGGGCGEPSLGDERVPTDISPADRSPAESRTGGNVFRVAVQSNDLVGLAKEGRERAIGGLLSALGHEPDGGAD